MVDGHVISNLSAPFRFPQNLALSNDGYFLVGDTLNHCIFAVNPSLNDVRTLLNSLPYFNTFCLDPSGSRLYVGEWGGQDNVLVYYINSNVGQLFT